MRVDRGAVRDALRESLRGVSGNVAVSTSGGIDSSSLVLSLLDLGVRPTVISFTLEGRTSSDFLAARRLAKHFGLDFVSVLLPIDESTVKKQIEDVVRFGASKKTSIECLVPFLSVLESLNERNIETLVVGSAADGHFGLSKRAMIHYRDTLEKFQEFRNDYFSKSDPAQTKTLKAIGAEYGVEVHAPYVSEQIFRLFANSTWEELNTPRQKEAIRQDFPELDALKIKRHTNLQLGDSGIAELIGRVAIKYYAPKAKSPVSAYNALRRSLV